MRHLHSGLVSWFQLDPQSIAERVTASGSAANAPSLERSLLHGIIGFTLVSVAGFAPWAVFGRWVRPAVGEVGMYIACAVVFIGLSGLLLHRLIIGPGSLGRFYKLFAIAFAVYSVAWIVGWMSLHGRKGSLAGLFAGTALMGWILVRAFEAGGAVTLIKVVAALFILNSLGYFGGGWVEHRVSSFRHFAMLGFTMPMKVRITTAMLLWGVCYGIGFGAGLGLAFYFCQSKTRALLAPSAGLTGSSK